MSNHRHFAKHTNNAEDYRRAKELRRTSSFAERLLWNALRSLPKETNLKFRRQHPIHPYIADFACVALKLIIETDGESHDTRLEYDANRDRFLERMGYTVLRFTNEDVYWNIGGVVTHIISAAEKQEAILCKTPPLTPPQGEGN